MPIFKNDGSTNQPISKITYTDGSTDRDITSVFKNDAGTWRQVFGTATTAETLAWASSAPTGIFEATTDEPGGAAIVRFSVSTTGTFAYTFVTINNAGGGSPTSGTFRPGLTGVDLTSYEVSITVGSVAGSGIISSSGSLSNTTGTYQNLDTSGLVGLQLTGSGSGTVSVSISIREIANPGTNIISTAFTLSVVVP